MLCSWRCGTLDNGGITVNKELIKYLKYECEDWQETKKLVKEMDDEETLFAYVNNYNWDDGFEIPSIILKNKHCKLAAALAIFYDAGSAEMLIDKDMMNGTSEWAKFVKALYNQIMQNKYEQGVVGYMIPLTKVQKYKIGKVISEKEKIFITDVAGIDARVIV